MKHFLTYFAVHVTLATSALATANAPAIAAFHPAAESTATFEASGKPGFIKIKGQGAKVEGKLELVAGDAKGTFNIDLNGFNTGIGLRDRHMKEKYLETGTFPQAQLLIEHVDLPKGFVPGQAVNDAKFTGKLTLKNVTKPVEGTVKISGANMQTTADFAFQLTEFPLGVPTYMGITVADAVNIHVDIPAFTAQ